jgi:hypothetical protein
VNARRVRRVGVVAACAAVAALAGCATPAYEVNWNRLRTGMSRDDVQGLLGQPSSRHLPKSNEDGTPPAPGRGERWQYGDTLSSFATGAVFPEEADERSWRVFFANDGTVSGFRAPEWAEGKQAKDP